MKTINGKTYPLWSQFVGKKNEWIGGTLQDFGDSMDKNLFDERELITEIIDITLEPNGKENAFFMVKGKDFDCGFSTSVGGIGGNQEEPWITFSGYNGHEWRIKKPEEKHE